MAFTEDLGVFFDESDFAVQAAITLPNNSVRVISVIFDATTQGIQLYDSNIEADTPSFQCKTSDLTGVKTGNQVVIENKTYAVGRKEPDGTGVTTVYLKT